MLAALYPQEYSWYSFLLQAESTPGPYAVGRIGSIEKSNDLIRNRTHDPPACSIVPQPTTLPRAPSERCKYETEIQTFKIYMLKSKAMK
jgi:hypothetical protein